MNLDAILDQLGFGKYQQRLFLISTFVVMYGGFPMIVNLFTTELPDYRCNISETVKKSLLQEKLLQNISIVDELWFSEDISGEKWVVEDTKWPTCSYNLSSNKNFENISDSLDIIHCQEWIYDTSVFLSTAASEFDLTCSREWLRYLARSVVMVGMFFGSLFFGWLSDRYGRKAGTLLSLTTMCVCSILSALSVNYWMFLIFQTFFGATTIGTFVMTFILLMELVGKEWRSPLGLALSFLASVGKALASGLGYFIRDWRWLQGSIALPALFIIPLIWFTPPSPRWLMAKGREEETRELIEKVAKTNNLDIPKELFYNNPKRNDATSSKKRSISDLFVYSWLKRTIIILIYVWSSCSTIYYGFLNNSSAISGNIYLNVVATVLAELPAGIIAIYLNKKLGRKGTMFYTHLVTGIVCILSLIPFNESGRWAYFIINTSGKCAITIAFNSLYIYTSEIFPTEYRGICFGTCSMFSRIGGVASPFIISLEAIHKSFPMIVLGIISIIASVTIIFIPDTTGSNLPQFVEDCENFEKNQQGSTFSFLCCLPSTRDENSDKTEV